MRTTTFGTVLASLAVAAGTMTVLAAAPAQAATPVQVTFSLGGKSQVVAPFKGSVGFFKGGVSYTLPDTTTAPVTAGDAVLESRKPGTAWKAVKTDATADTIDFGTYGSHANGNTQYRVHYLGGTDGVTTWDPAYSDPVTVLTLWKLNDRGVCGHTCRFYGHLSPKAKHHTVTIQVKHGTWKKYKVVKTDAKSRWSATVVPTFGKGTLYRAIAARSKSEVATSSHIWRFTKVRTFRSFERAAAPRL